MTTNCGGQIRKNLYLCIISPVRLLQKKWTAFIFRHSDHSKATFAFYELLSRRHLLQIGNETKITAGSKHVSSKVCGPQSTNMITRGNINVKYVGLKQKTC